MTTNKTIFLTLLLVIVIYGGYLRFHDLGAMSFWMDEAFSVRAAMTIREHGRHVDDEGFMHFGWLPQHYLMAALLTDRDDMHARARWPSAIAGTLTIIICSYLAYQLTGSLAAGLLAGFLVAFSVTDIAWSRQARGYALLQLLGLSAFMTAWRAMLNRKSAWLLASMCLLILAIMTHRAGYVYWLITAGLVVALAGCTPLWTTRNLKLWLVLFVPLAVGWLLPKEAAQGLQSAFTEMTVEPSKPTFAKAYAGVVINFWQWNLIWLCIGTAGLLITKFRIFAPIALGVLAYGYVLSEKTDLFHFRYLLPVLPFVHVAVASGPVLLIRGWLARHPGKKLFPVVMASLFVWSSSTQNLNFTPEGTYRLGPTAPQPDWQAAMHWIRGQHPHPVTIMALPVFHDIYIGEANGTKYFLPFSFSGRQGHWQEKAPYTKAETIWSFEDAVNAGGFIVLDNFSFQRLKNEEWRFALKQIKPSYLAPDASVAVWKLSAPR